MGLENIQASIDLFACPRCGDDLNIRDDCIFCRRCLTTYGVDEGIPLFFEECGPDGGLTNKMKRFYNENPFPGYEEIENVADLIDKAEKSVFARMLNKQIPFGARILEIGCGTGQLTNYLAVAQRIVVGADMSLSSLKLAQEFKKRNGLERAIFCQMNLFRPAFPAGSFHVVISNGVLHHTGNPRLGFETIAKLVKKGGFLCLGLYNRFGRVLTDVRKVVFAATTDKLKFLDPHTRDRSLGRADIWFKDQYKNPHESKHTIGEVLRWFNQSNFEFCYGIPSPVFFEGFASSDLMFMQHSAGNFFGRIAAQVRSIPSGWRDGGLFIMIGRKK
mgnify:FL=1